MSTQWNNDGTFHLGINMAGAISAGAYTAGVLDFLTEALDQWYAARAAGQAVPGHKLSIDIFTGASAGGMCAAISAVMLQGTFDHIHDLHQTGTSNRFYESWVNRIDIEPLLGTADLKPGQPVISLLDSTIIDEIADYALAPGASTPPPYLSESLTLFLTLTNVRGVPYSLNGTAPGSAEEDIAYYADRLQFETVRPGSLPTSPFARPLPVGGNGGAWPLLKDAAKATGAFPIFLAPRQIVRSAGDYYNAPWQEIDSALPECTPPHWTLKPTDNFTTLNVDGGMTDNDPFELAHDFLATRNPLATRDPLSGELHNPDAANAANCAVLTVAPFPADELYNPVYDFAKESSVIGMLPNLFSVLISQSRFQGETLADIANGDSYSRFVLAPSDPEHPNRSALQCGLLSAFGGFFERGFRAHDYQLGRRNCQKFLVDCFRLDVANPIIASGLAGLDATTRAQVVATFDPEGKGTLPIVPRCGSAVPEVPNPTLATITSARVNQILNWIVARLHAVAKPMLLDAMGPGFKDFTIHAAVDLLISTVGKKKISDFLQQELRNSISG